MAIRRLLALARSPHRRLLSTSTAAHSPAMPYGRIAAAVRSNLRRLENPDPFFLRHGSPLPTLTDHTPILALPATHVTTLPNGLRVATESSLSSQTATVGVSVDAGSRFETEDNNGIAHFLEGMVFRGSEKRSSEQLKREIEDMGGHLNAWTSREQTAYYLRVMRKDVDRAVEILADILQHSTFDEREIVRNRVVSLREMEELAGQPEEVLFDHLHAAAFQFTSLGRTILGTALNIKFFTQKDLEDYMENHYTPNRMVISAAGAIRHEDLVEQVKELFDDLPDNPTTASQLVAKEPATFTGSEVRIIDDDIPLAHFAVAFCGASSTDPDSIGVMVMQSMLGFWDKTSGGGKHMGSELAQMIGINEIAESMMAFSFCYRDTGLFGVYAVAKPDCVDDLAWAIMNEITKLCYRVSDEDVIRARNQLKSVLQLRLDGSSTVVENIGRQLLTYGRRIPAAELFARIDAVDASTVKRIANRFIFDQDIAIAAMGPITKLPDYNWFRGRTYFYCY